MWTGNRSGIINMHDCCFRNCYQELATQKCWSALLEWYIYSSKDGSVDCQKTKQLVTRYHELLNVFLNTFRQVECPKHFDKFEEFKETVYIFEKYIGIKNSRVWYCGTKTKNKVIPIRRLEWIVGFKRTYIHITWEFQERVWWNW